MLMFVVLGELNNAAAKKLDLEAWFPGSGMFQLYRLPSSQFARALRSDEEDGTRSMQRLCLSWRFIIKLRYKGACCRFVDGVRTHAQRNDVRRHEKHLLYFGELPRRGSRGRTGSYPTLHARRW